VHEPEPVVQLTGYPRQVFVEARNEKMRQKIAQLAEEQDAEVPPARQLEPLKRSRPRRRS
jgi:hypothetical protein